MEQFIQHLGVWLESKVGKDKTMVVLKKFVEEHNHNVHSMSLDELNDLAQNILIKQGKIKEPPKADLIDI